jgi:gluconokinase
MAAADQRLCPGDRALVLILMGVVGAGKTTVGVLLAQRLGWRFRDADDFHPAQNIEKMRRGIELTDQDRVPWLEALHSAIQQWNAAGENVILACSALKRGYRERLSVGPVRFVYLKGSHDLILSRLQARRGHFASASILDCQFADLEEPDDAIAVDLDKSPDAIVSEILEKLGRLDPATT